MPVIDRHRYTVGWRFGYPTQKWPSEPLISTCKCSLSFSVRSSSIAHSRPARDADFHDQLSEPSGSRAPFRLVSARSLSLSGPAQSLTAVQRNRSKPSVAVLAAMVDFTFSCNPWGGASFIVHNHWVCRLGRTLLAGIPQLDLRSNATLRSFV
jgi:hypothetical protein